MTQYSEPFLLSSKGSTRATAYQFGNKSVTLNGKTHVVWLDAIAQVRGRTFDHATGQWGETIDLFEGCDNHTNPALIADAKGHLHVAYGPHGWWGQWNFGCFKYAVAEEPHSLECLKEHSQFGYDATYACLVGTPSGLDAIVYRGGEVPASLMFQRQRPMGGWTDARPLMAQAIPPQYTHWGAHLTCARDGTLYAIGHFYNLNTDARSLGVAALKSVDMGDTWTDLRDRPAVLPIHLGPRFAVPAPMGHPYAMGVVTDSKRNLWAGTYDSTPASRSVLLSRWDGSGWQTLDLAPFVPEEYTVVYGAMSIDTADRLHVAATGLRIEPGMDEHKAWGHASLEVFHLFSRDGNVTFECNPVSTPDDAVANWLPNISLAGVYNPVGKPVILYTHGDKGEGCSPTTETDVYCVMIEEL